MKILIALASSSGQISGVQRHAINVALGLLTRGEITAVHLVSAPWQQAFMQDLLPRGETRLHLHTAPIGNSAWSRNLWFYAQLPKLAAVLHADIVHLAYPVPLQRHAFSCPTVVTLHDMYAFDIPANFGFPKVFFNRAVLRACVDAANAVACVSHSTLSRLRSILPKTAPEKSLVIYNALATNAASACTMEPPKWGIQPFLLCVAQHRRNKNILTALQVFQRLLRSSRLSPQTRLLIVGIPGPETQSIRDFVSASYLQQSVLLLNGISDAELQWSYRNCSVLLAPSIAEGFGLPVAEALLAGCRIVCSDIPAFREIGDDRCRYVPLGPGEVEAFADAVSAVLDQASPAPIALPQLSLPVIAEEYIRLYRSLLVQPSPGNSSDSPSFQFSGETQHPI